MTALVLASASTVRRDLLANVGLEVLVEPAMIDEMAVKASYRQAGWAADELALALAELKALRVSARRSGSLVIGADQLLICGDVYFDKPPDLDHARAQLIALRGKDHFLISAVVSVRDGVRLWHHVAKSRLTMRLFSDDFLDSYITSSGNTILSSVGSYCLEYSGAQLFSKIDGDYFSILGLPLLPLLDHLRQQGIILQ